MTKQDIPRVCARVFSSIALVGIGAAIANGTVRPGIAAFCVFAVGFVLEKTLFAKK